MAYKRYIYKEGKKHGPYYYKNVRNEGKVKSVYLGKAENKGKRPLKVAIIFLVALLIMISALFFLQNRAIVLSKIAVEKSAMPLEIDQILIKVLVKSGEFVEKEIRVVNIGEEEKNVQVEVVGLSDIIHLVDKEFTIKPGQSKIVRLNLSSFNKEKEIENNPGVYIGKITAKTDYYQKDIPVIIEIESPNVLFDINLNPIATDRKITVGESTTFEIRVFNLQSIDSYNADIEYFVKDINGNTIINEKENVVVKTQASFFKTLKIPQNLKAGSYVFIAQASFGDSVGTASYLFEVEGLEKESGTANFIGFCRNDPLCWALSIIFLLLLLTIGAYLYFFLGVYIYKRLFGASEFEKLRAKEERGSFVDLFREWHDDWAKAHEERIARKIRLKEEKLRFKERKQKLKLELELEKESQRILKEKISREQQEEELRRKKQEERQKEKELEKIEQEKILKLENEKQRVLQEELEKKRQKEEIERRRKEEKELRYKNRLLEIEEKKKLQGQRKKESEKRRFDFLHRLGLVKTEEEKRELKERKAEEKQQREEEKKRQDELRLEEKEELQKQKDLEKRKEEGEKQKEELKKLEESRLAKKEEERKLKLEKQRQKEEEKRLKLEKQRQKEELKKKPEAYAKKGKAGKKEKTNLSDLYESLGVGAKKEGKGEIREKTDVKKEKVLLEESIQKEEKSEEGKQKLRGFFSGIFKRKAKLEGYGAKAEEGRELADLEKEISELGSIFEEKKEAKKPALFGGMQRKEAKYPEEIKELAEKEVAVEPKIEKKKGFGLKLFGKKKGKEKEETGLSELYESLGVKKAEEKAKVQTTKVIEKKGKAGKKEKTDLSELYESLGVGAKKEGKDKDSGIRKIQEKEETIKEEVKEEENLEVQPSQKIRLEGKSRNFIKFNKLMIKANNALKNNNKQKAKILYLKARDLYLKLEYLEKKEIYNELVDLYNRLV